LFAIAIARLILTIQSPAAAERSSNRRLFAALGQVWALLLAVVPSFVVKLMIWSNHHDFIRMLRGVDHSLLFVNEGVADGDLPAIPDRYSCRAAARRGIQRSRRFLLWGMICN
jgi:ABC-type arginine transport system permease subunit